MTRFVFTLAIKGDIVSIYTSWSVGVALTLRVRLTALSLNMLMIISG